MSYVKDLMEIAARWIACNTSASGKLTFPRTPFVAITRDRADIERYERAVDRLPDPKKVAEMRELIQKLRVLYDDVDAQRAGVREAEIEAENLLNEVETTAQVKYTVDGGAVNSLLHGRWCLAWALAGHNVFELGNDFVAAMLLTDPREIRFDELRLPFPGILVTIPDRFVAGVEGLSYTKLHVSHVDGVWELYATDGAHVLDTRVAEGEALSWELFERLEGDDTDADTLAIRALRQITFGMLAYVTAVDRAIEERPGFVAKKRMGDDRLIPRPRVHDVGRSITIDPILVKYARAGAREVALQIKHRYVVRGHYRSQPHGPGRRDRKTIWIQPFFKGPEEGATITHTYRPEIQEETP